MQHHRARPGTAAPATVVAPPAFPVWGMQRNARRDAVLPGVFPVLQPLRTRVLHSHTL